MTAGHAFVVIGEDEDVVHGAEWALHNKKVLVALVAFFRGFPFAAGA